MNDISQIEYKVKELRKMISAENADKTGGYGAHLSHWCGAANPINIDSGALLALYWYYVEKLEKMRSKKLD